MMAILQDNSIREGDLAPDFSLPDESGREVRLSGLRGKTVILYFYPKDATPGCTLEAQGFRDHEYELSDVGAVVLGVSRDSIESHQTFCSELSLRFQLLSDTSGDVCRLYGVLKDKMMFGTKAVGIVRSTFLIDDAGVVRKIYRRVKPEGHAEEVLAEIKKLS